MKKTWMVLLAAALVSGCSERETSRAVAPVKVRIMVAAPTEGAVGQAYSGTIEESGGTSLSFSAVGTVQRISVSEGQFVQRGQLIGLLDDTSARSAYEAALATKEQALDAQQRMQQLHDAGSLPEIKWVEVQTQVRQALASEQIARKALADTRLVAPYSGYVAQKSVEAGANVAPGITVVRLVSIDEVKVKISVPEEEIARFAVGQELTVGVAALAGRTFQATVTEKGVSADPLSRSYEVKATIRNTGRELLPGMIAEVRCAAAMSQQQMVLPPDIIQIDADNRPFVWTVTPQQTARRAYVTLGENTAQGTVVTAGLTSGTRIIAEGWQKVSTDMSVTE